MPERLAALRAAGDAIRILTNNTTLTVPGMAAALCEAGLPVKADEIVAGQDLMASMLAERGFPARGPVYILGAPALGETLRAAGLAPRDLVADAPTADATGPCALVLGYLAAPDAELLASALALLLRPDCLFLALHRNRVFKNAGRLELGLGAWVAALETASGREALITGKPAPAIFRRALASLGAAPGDVAMVGDDPFADLAPARALGLRTVFVLSGKYADASILDALPADARPDHVIPSLAELPDAL